jgi:O-antigen ligase
LLGLLLVVPWLGGGRDNLALILNFFALGVAIFFVWRRSDRPAIGGWLPVVMLALLVWGGLSLLWTVNRFQTVSWLVQWYTVIGTFVIGRWLATKPKWRNKWLRGYVWIVAIASLYGMYLLVAGEYDRLTSTFYWANPMAGFVLPAIILSAFWWADTGRKLDGAVAIITTAALLLTASRGGMLSLGVVAVVAAVTVRRRSKFWLRLVLMIVAAFILSTLVTQLRSWQHHGTASNVSQDSRYQEALQGESLSVADRLNYLKSSAKAVGEHPIEGTGAGTFATVYPEYQLRVISATTNAHNFYAQTAVELGLIGGLLLTAIAVMAIWSGRIAAKTDATLLPVVLGLAAMLIHLGLDIDASYPAILALVGVLIGITYQSKTQYRRYLPSVLAIALVLALPVISMYQSQMWRERGNIEQDNHDYAKAADDFAHAASGIIYDPDVLTAEGINYYTLAAGGVVPKSEAVPQAIQPALLAMASDSLDAQHYFLMARANLLIESYDLAEDNYRRALDHDRFNHPEYYVDLARLYIFQQRYADAKNELDTVIGLYPADVIANRHLDQTVSLEIDTAKALQTQIADKL